MTDPVLFHERIAAGEPLTANGGRRLVLVVHGALGSGQNFRSFIKRLAAACPALVFELVDSRGHGQSHGFGPPHTIAACAGDLFRLATLLRAAEGLELGAILGHSLGGKIALEFSRLHGDPGLQIWALDSNPGKQDPNEAHQIKHVMAAVRSMPEPIVTRQQVVEHFRARGLSNGLAQWMTTNLARDGERLRWVLDLDVIASLLDDYFVRDLWPFLEQTGATSEHHLVIAERSDRMSPELRARAEGIARSGNLRVHQLADAGHWVHVDNPEGLLGILVPELGRLH
ncbi:MAG TPA: alpha/beta hydrolase [Polyangiaceae bacterium]|jgi:pimeloyl-ACP methyl ester carboxylesterase|nr:alpha/beta hydrolase [Polyangiaceae bacterium]